MVKKQYADKVDYARFMGKYSRCVRAALFCGCGSGGGSSSGLCAAKQAPDRKNIEAFFLPTMSDNLCMQAFN